MEQKVNSDISVEDEEQIVVLPPKENLQKLKIHTNFDILTDQTENKLMLYVRLDVNYLKNLMKSNIKDVPQNVKKHINCDTIFYRQLETQDHIKGNLKIIYQHYKGLTFEIFFKNPHKKYNSGWAYIDYKNVYEWKKKGVRIQNESSEKLDGLKFNFLIESKDINDLFKQHFLLQMTFTEYESAYTNKYPGIQNSGNTCYLNSIIQIIYFIKPIRKIIIEAKQPKKLTSSLQELFCELAMGDNPTVSADNLLACFNHIFTAYQQQDIHEFILHFFSMLSDELPQLKQFWQGKGKYIIYSKTKKYKNIQEDNFNQLDIHLQDHLGNPLLALDQGLKYLLKDQKIDDQIDTDQFGKLDVMKRRQFETLPDLLFFNLKRYKYDPKRKVMTKVFAQMSFPHKINLQFLLGTPKGQDNDEYTYSLFAITVHKGRSPLDGHYYSFINTSQICNSETWFRFNDSAVYQANLNYILKNFQGKKFKQIYLNKDFCRWDQRSIESDQTAYLLVYFRDNIFENYQKVNYKIPEHFIKKAEQKRKQFQEASMKEVRLYILNDQPIQEFTPFDDELEYTSVPLSCEHELIKQLREIQDKYLATTIGTVWKVNRLRKTIKYCGKKYGPNYLLTVDQIYNNRKGHEAPDYLLIIPLMLSTRNIQNLDKSKDLVLLQIKTPVGKQFQVLERVQLQTFLADWQKKKGRKVVLNDEKQYFKYRWNDYCTVDFASD